MPKVVAVALVGLQLLAIAAFAAPAAAAPCYQQGQPAPPAAPNTAALQSNCSTAAGNVQTALLVGAYGGRAGTYGVQKFAERIVATSIGSPDAQVAYFTCVSRVTPSSPEGTLAALRACPASSSNFLGCIEHDQAPVACAKAFPGRLAGESDKFVANAPLLCLITTAAFAPDTTGTPAPAPSLVCYVPYLYPSQTGVPFPPVSFAWGKVYAAIP